tara:strand:- start:79 stop:294 length:216 start_codon:yes stop_codon:yes gene_type:complete
MSQNKIQVFINGKKEYCDNESSLYNFLKFLKISSNGIAIEINQTVVPKSEYKRKIIKKNDRIEIVHFIGGG